MAVLLRRRHLPAFTAFTFLLFFSSSASALSLIGGDSTEAEVTVEGARLTALDSQERFAGPGSSPPTCRSKCGRCSPCKPVHVPIHPGFSSPLEYYPEAWRCKCGSTLFMP